MHKKRKSSIMSLKAVSQETKAKPLAKTKPLETTDAKVNNNEKVNNNDNPAITPDVAASNAVTPEGTSTSVEVEGKQAEAQAETDEKQTENEPEEEGVSEGDEEYEGSEDEEYEDEESEEEFETDSEEEESEEEEVHENYLKRYIPNDPKSRIITVYYGIVEKLNENNTFKKTTSYYFELTNHFIGVSKGKTENLTNRFEISLQDIAFANVPNNNDSQIVITFIKPRSINKKPRTSLTYKLPTREAALTLAENIQQLVSYNKPRDVVMYMGLGNPNNTINPI